MRYVATNTDKTQWLSHGDDRIVQNVVNLLNLSRYEVPYDRTRGMDLSILDFPADVASEMFKESVKELISEYEPRAKVISTDVSYNLMGDVILKVVLDID